MSYLDKYRGLLAGVLLGDALGAPHEFRSQTDVYTGKIQYRAKIHFGHGPVKHLALGQITDDGEMSLIIARHLLFDNGYNQRDVVLDYIDWAQKAPFMGLNTQYLFKNITAKDSDRRIATYQKRYNARKEVTRYNKKEKRGFGWEQEEWSQSNGSLMRIAPLALLNDLKAVDSDTIITNPHPINREVNKLYVTMLVKCLTTDDSPTTIFNEVIQHAVEPEVIAVLNQVVQDYGYVVQHGKWVLSRDVTKCKGWVLHSFYVALLAFLAYQRMDHGLNWIIMLGGDTDTNAAIGGALIGAHLGYNKMNEEPITRDNLQLVLTAGTTSGDFPRVAAYTPYRFMDMTEDLVAKYHPES